MKVFIDLKIYNFKDPYFLVLYVGEESTESEFEIIYSKLTTIGQSLQFFLSFSKKNCIQ